MKRWITALLIGVCLVSLSGCQAAPAQVLQTPPALTVICGEESVPALQGTYSWYYQKIDGTMAGVEADALHPLEAKEHMTPLYFRPSHLSRIDPLTAYLLFETAPDTVRVQCWIDEEPRDDVLYTIPVTETALGVENGGTVTGYQMELKDGGYIYEVVAEWESAKGYGGTASYSFYTVKPDLTMYPVGE